MRHSKGAPTPLSADTIKKADAAATPATAPPPEPKVTEKPSDTGAGAAANEAAKPRRVRKPKTEASK